MSPIEIAKEILSTDQYYGDVIPNYTREICQAFIAMDQELHEAREVIEFYGSAPFKQLDEGPAMPKPPGYRAREWLAKYKGAM